MLQETRLDNLKIIELQKLKDVKTSEADLLSIVEVMNGDKVPVIPVIKEDGELSINEIRLNEEYSLKSEIEVKLYDTWANLKCEKELIDFAIDRKKSSHFNKILCRELEKSVNTATDLFDLISKRRFNNNYHLIVNEDVFMQLLKMKNSSDELIMKLENNKYMINGVVVVVCSTATKIILVDLSDLIVRCIGDTMEVKNADLVRHGKRLFSGNYDFGIGLLDTTNVFICDTL